jgi:hypothetical protein
MTMFKPIFNMVLDQGFKLTIKIPCTCIAFCILFGQICGRSGFLVFMTVFSLGLSIVQNFILGCQMSFTLSSFHRPLLSLTLVFICWLGEVQGWCCESCIVVCMCAFKRGWINVRVGLGLVWVVCPVWCRIYRASPFRLRCFFLVFVLIVRVILSQRQGC